MRRWHSLGKMLIIIKTASNLSGGRWLLPSGVPAMGSVKGIPNPSVAQAAHPSALAGELMVRSSKKSRRS